jgi:hypothetical protein
MKKCYYFNLYFINSPMLAVKGNEDALPEA